MPFAQHLRRMCEQCRQAQPHSRIHEAQYMCFKSCKLVHASDVECSHIVDSSQKHHLEPILYCALEGVKQIGSGSSCMQRKAHTLRCTPSAMGLLKRFAHALLYFRHCDTERVQLIRTPEMSATAKAAMHAFHQIWNARDHVAKWPLISHSLAWKHR